MTNKLVLAVQQKHKRSNSKSNLKNKQSNIQQLSQTNQKDVQVIFTSAKVTELIENFSKQISQPIQIFTELYRSKVPQKCLQHNNISTLFCLKDEKLLCAGCMYQTPIHKGHKVIPITQAQEQMKIGIKNTYGVIEEHLRMCKKAIQKTSINLQRAEKQYPELMQQVHNFFMGLHQLLIDRKNEHLQLLNQTWSRLRYQNHLMHSELTRICDYVQNKLKEISENQGDDDVTLNKNIIEHLSRITDLIDQDTVVIEENNYAKQINKFADVTEFASKNLVLFEMKNKQIHSLYLADYKLKKSNSKTSVKKNTYGSIIKSPINSKPKVKEQLQKSAEQKLLEMMQLEQQRKSERVPPKNRYSMSQIKLLKDLNQKKKSFEKDQKKKKQLTPTKSPKSINNITATSFKSNKSPKKQKSNVTKK